MIQRQISLSITVLAVPVAMTVTNLEPKCPSGDNLQGLGCLFWKSAAIIHSSALKKWESCNQPLIFITDSIDVLP